MQSSPIENIKKKKCANYTKKFMNQYQSQREDLKRINLLFNVASVACVVGQSVHLKKNSIDFVHFLLNF